MCIFISGNATGRVHNSVRVLPMEKWKNRESERAGMRFPESGDCSKTVSKASTLTHLRLRRGSASGTSPFGPGANRIGQSSKTTGSGAALGIRGPHGERVGALGIHRGSTIHGGIEAAEGARAATGPGT